MQRSRQTFAVLTAVMLAASSGIAFAQTGGGAGGGMGGRGGTMGTTGGSLGTSPSTSPGTTAPGTVTTPGTTGTGLSNNPSATGRTGANGLPCGTAGTVNPGASNDRMATPGASGGVGASGC